MAKASRSIGAFLSLHPGYAACFSGDRGLGLAMLKTVPVPAELAPTFDAAFRSRFADLLAWRRDVRRFRADAVPESLLAQALDLAGFAPSVGSCQPTRFVRIDDSSRRAAIIANFEAANAEALAEYRGERRQSYASLKLAGLREAPIHIGVFCDEQTARGHGLGVRTMPEMRRYSAVCALHTFWLAARIVGLGVGWVSILDPSTIHSALDLPEGWSFVAYLCVGWPQEEQIVPELERAGWQARVSQSITRR
jgi:5,6-dimethylbenzimidazole synthase